jgi:ABC-type branched-subunit amino acid transport system ATPase component
LIGHTSPEIYAAFPRGMGLTAFQSIVTGFEGVFSRRGSGNEERDRVLGLLEVFQDMLVGGRFGSAGNGKEGEKGLKEVANKLFAQFTPAQQALLLILRAIVSRPPLLILDEPSQGMDEVIWARCKALLEKEWKENPSQAVIVVSHYDDEVPWAKSRGRVLKLDEGVATVEGR